MKKFPWWKTGIVYQIYPASFQDSNGDGIGDLPGIISRLEYLQALGVTIVWLCPLYASPMADNGYDISDYQAINPLFGTMKDFDCLLQEAHIRGLRIVMDLVVNHTSDEHEWFARSRSGLHDPYRDFYIWREGRNGGKEPPNNWRSLFGGSAWQRDEATGQYYLHLFHTKQPDLNWDNPRVRQAIYRMMRWWLDKGVDGFRMDVISLISKPKELADGVPDLDGYADPVSLVASGPHIHEYLREMRCEVLSAYDVTSIGELIGVDAEEACRYAASDRSELDMLFQFDQTNLTNTQRGKWNLTRVRTGDFKRCMSRWQEVLEGRAWNGLYLSNHDRPRCVSYFGCDATAALAAQSAKMLATCLHLMQGTPHVYQGEELGMTNAPFGTVDDFRDTDTLSHYHHFVKSGAVSPEEMLEIIRFISRDNARTPMQWDNSPNAGFTSGKPWILVNPNYRILNVRHQQHDPSSVLAYYQRLIALRNQLDVILAGHYRFLDMGEEAVYAYVRETEEEWLCVVCNFMPERPVSFTVAEPRAVQAFLVLTNGDVAPGTPMEASMTLTPYEARIYYAGNKRPGTGLPN